MHLKPLPPMAQSFLNTIVNDPEQFRYIICHTYYTCIMCLTINEQKQTVFIRKIRRYWSQLVFLSLKNTCILAISLLLDIVAVKCMVISHILDSYLRILHNIILYRICHRCFQEQHVHPPFTCVVLFIFPIKMHLY